MADWASIAGSVANAVGSVSSTISTLGAGDMNKAVRAAKKAGKYASELEKKKYPSWDVKGTKDLAKEIGITTRAAWKKARAEAMDSASDEAYNEVMDMYKKQVDSRINIAENTSSQEYLDSQLQLAQANANTVALQNKANSGIGCAIMCICITVAGSLVYLVVNYLC